jgi:RNA polymerase sigma factor (sigma-70 family)
MSGSEQACFRPARAISEQKLLKMKNFPNRETGGYSIPVKRESRKRYFAALNDEELCQIYRHTQEQEILVELLNRYERMLISIALPFTKVIDSISDFKNDMFLILQRALLASQPNVFRHWLGRITRNKLYDRVRKRRYELREELPDQTLKLSKSWDYNIDFEYVHRLIEELKPDQRVYIEMAFFLGYKSREIREKLQWPEDKPRKVRQNAIRNLKRVLGAEGSDFIKYLETH